MKRWTKDAKKDSIVCDHAKLADANDELSMTSCRNELMCSVYEIFTRSVATTRHIKMCKRKIREMIELVEKDMEVLSWQEMMVKEKIVLLIIPSLVMLRSQIAHLIICLY